MATPDDLYRIKPLLDAITRQYEAAGSPLGPASNPENVAAWLGTITGNHEGSAPSQAKEPSEEERT